MFWPMLNSFISSGMSISLPLTFKTFGKPYCVIGTIYDLEGVTIEMGWINDQFVQNAMTILAEKRLALLVRNIDQYAFCKCTDIDVAVNQLVNGAS